MQSQDLKKHEAELLKDMDILFEGVSDKIKGISDNSKLVRQGELFVLMPSFAKFSDGGGKNIEEYVKEAFQNGAIFSIIPKSYHELYLSESVKQRYKDHIVIVDENDFILYVKNLCKRYYNNLPKHLLGVTGTNGKTSTVDFLRQFISLRMGKAAASIGTMGIVVNKGVNGADQDQEIDMSDDGYNGRTTSSLVSNYRILSRLKNNYGIDYVAMELSSHGLEQERLSGLNFDSISFTSFSQDHLDYHGDMDKYLDAKLRILSLTRKVFVCEDGVPAKVINKIRLKAPSGVRVISYSANTYKKFLGDNFLSPSGLREKVSLIGDFQYLNATAAALQVASSFAIDESKLIKLIPSLKPVKGRMEIVSKYKNTFFVIDYAHSPDGIEKALKALQPYKSPDGKIAIVFGAGGDRDRDKRSTMGRIAAEHADVVVITDDNPRNENPAQIRSEILTGVEEMVEAGLIAQGSVDMDPDRQRAIEKALLKMSLDDKNLTNIILVAGKGHENTQIYENNRVVDYNDADAIQRVIAKLSSIWSIDEVIDVVNPISINSTGRERKALKAIKNVVIDSRKVEIGSLFIAIRGDKNDGHDYLDEAFSRGANFAIIDNPAYVNRPGTILVKNTFLSLQLLGTAGRNRLSSDAKVVGVTGSFGKTSTKEMLSIVLSDQVGADKVYKNIGSLNNHYGVPLTLANMPRDTKIAIIEMGMNRAGEIKNHTFMVKPHVALITTVGLAHTANFSSLNDIAIAKSEIFYSNSPIAVINKDLSVYPTLELKARQHNAKKIITFSSHKTLEADIKAKEIVMDHSGTRAVITGLIPLHLRVVGMQWIQNALGVLGVVKALGLDMRQACKSLEKFEPVEGRGKIYRNERKDITIIDESYNAQPLAMITSIKNLEYYKSKRNIAILGDMYDLGQMTKKAHIDLAEVIMDSKIHVLYLCGEYMYDLYKELEGKHHQIKTYHANTPDEILKIVKRNLIHGDLYMVKGSRGSGEKPRMFKVVEGLLNL